MYHWTEWKFSKATGFVYYCGLKMRSDRLVFLETIDTFWMSVLHFLNASVRLHIDKFI